MDIVYCPIKVLVMAGLLFLSAYNSNATFRSNKGFLCLEYCILYNLALKTCNDNHVCSFTAVFTADSSISLTNIVIPENMDIMNE